MALVSASAGPAQSPVIGANRVLYVVGGYSGKVFAIVPEPSTLVLLCMGASALLVFICRERFVP